MAILRIPANDETVREADAIVARLQPLGIAWDSRSVEDDGQRWFHLYPDDDVMPGDRLHWTGRNQTWIANDERYMQGDIIDAVMVKPTFMII